MNFPTDPTVNDDTTQGWAVGDVWNSPATGRTWIARNVNAGAAVWELTAPPSVQIAGDVHVANGSPVSVFNITAAAQTVVVDVTDFNSLGYQCTLGGTSSIRLEVSIDGVVWTNVPAMRLDTWSFAAGDIINAPTGTYFRANVASVKFARLRVTSYASNSRWVLYRSVMPAEGLDGIAPLPAGTNALGSVGLGPGTNLIGDVGGQVRATAGGITTWGRIPAGSASLQQTSLKASAGRLYTVFVYNAATTVRYLKFYNKASAPIVGTDTPFLTLALGPSQQSRFDFADIGAFFSTGIAFAITTGAADADATAPAANDLLGLNIGYA